MSKPMSDKRLKELEERGCHKTQEACREIRELRDDQKDWQKGVALIASALNLDTLCCVDINHAALEAMATIEGHEAAMRSVVYDLVPLVKAASNGRKIHVEELESIASPLNARLKEKP